jgi:hypothetical protein
MRQYIVPYIMCGVVTFGLHWHTLEGFRANASPPGYTVAFFALTVALWPLTIAATVFAKEWKDRT